MSLLDAFDSVKKPQKKEVKEKPKGTKFPEHGKNYTFDSNFLIDEWEQIKTYFRKGDRPAQVKAIANFEKHLKETMNNE